MGVYYVKREKKKKTNKQTKEFFSLKHVFNVNKQKTEGKNIKWKEKKNKIGRF